MDEELAGLSPPQGSRPCRVESTPGVGKSPADALLPTSFSFHHLDPDTQSRTTVDVDWWVARYCDLVGHLEWPCFYFILFLFLSFCSVNNQVLFLDF